MPDGERLTHNLPYIKEQFQLQHTFGYILIIITKNRN
jgi:hypothetical protein